MILATEDQEQQVFVDWLNLERITFYHIPNGGYRNQREGGKFKRLGVQAGVPDICIPVPSQSYHGLYVELKRKKGGVVSPSQKSWICRLNALGYKAIIALGAADAIEMTQRYFSANRYN